MGFFEMRDLPFEVCQDSGIQSKMGAGFGTESMHPDARCLDRDYRIEGVRGNRPVASPSFQDHVTKKNDGLWERE